MHFLGRIDTQLKVRGHRVETQAVEDILQTRFGEIEAAVLDYQNEELVAFVSAPSIAGASIAEVELAPEKWSRQILDVLAELLPAPSIPSRIFLIERFVMKPVSGKIDRQLLPKLADASPSAHQGAGNLKHNQPVAQSRAETGAASAAIDFTDSEPDCESALAICRAVLEAPVGWDSVFADHGGHSIVIARLAQRLQAAGWEVSVRALLSDCDTARKVAACPRHAPQSSSRPAAETGSCRKSTQRDNAAARIIPTGQFTVLQLLFLWLLYLPPLACFLGLIAFAEIGAFFMTARFHEFVAVGFFLYLSALSLPFASLLWVMVIKLVMGGHLYKNRVTPGVYPKWSRMHLRVWCVTRLESSVLVPLGTMFRSAPLMAYVLRRLGARVGDNLQCAHDVEFSGPLDLLTIGDDVAIQSGAYINLSRWLGQELHIGPVQLQSNCKIGMRAAIAGNVTVGRGSWINPFTPALNNVGEQEMWEGAPARFSGRCVDLKRTARACKPSRSAQLMEMFNILMQVFLDFWLLVVPTAAVSWFAASFIPVGETDVASEYFKVTPLSEIVLNMSIYGFVTTWAAVVLISLLVCVFLRYTPAAPGLYSSRGIRGYLLLYRVKKMNQVQRQWTWTITGQYLRALAGVSFPRLGATECDLMLNLVPELASADSKVFWSNGSFTNMLDHGAEHIKLRQLDMPRNFFSGTNCVVESGQFPSNFLLGVSTLGNDIQFRRQMRSRPGEPITIAGNPPVQFASAKFDEENESHALPSFTLFLTRVFLNDIFSIGLLPVAGMLAYVILYTGLLRLDGPLILSAFIAMTLAEVTLVLLCASIKKLLVGSEWGAAHSTPFWSWRHFSYFFAQDCFFAWCRRPLRMSAGTVLSNTILRRMGCRIGSRTIVSSPMQASDWNAVSIGDDCMINGILQLHTFENMMLKVKRAEIGNSSAVNVGATIMSGAVIEPEATILPLSLVLKEVHLTAKRSYEGSPVEPVVDPL